MKKFLRAVLVCSMMVWILGIPAGASGTATPAAGLEAQPCEAAALQEQIVPLSVAALDVEIPVGKLAKASSDFYLEAGEAVQIIVGYSPKSASMDFGLIAPDGLFHYVRTDVGNLDKTIRVNERGCYTFAMRNNSSLDTVRVQGFVYY